MRFLLSSGFVLGLLAAFACGNTGGIPATMSSCPASGPAPTSDCTRAGARQVFAGNHVAALTADDSTIYFARWDSVWLAPADGSAAPTQLATADVAQAIAVDGDHVFWADRSVIGSVAKDCSTNMVVSVPQNTPHGLAADGSTVFWGEGNGIVSAPEGGGPRTTVPITVPFGNPSDPYPDPQSVAVSGATLFWMDWQFGDILSIPKAGGTATVAGSVSGPANPRAFALFGGAVYWVNDSTDTGIGEVLAITPGQMTPTVLASQVPVGDGIAVDATGVYWSGTTSVLHVGLQGGAVRTVLDGLLFVGDVARTKSTTFFADGEAMTDHCSGVWAVPDAK